MDDREERTREGFVRKGVSLGIGKLGIGNRAEEQIGGRCSLTVKEE